MSVDPKNPNLTQAKPIPAEGSASNKWYWTRVALCSAIVVSVALSYSQLWQTAQKTAEAGEILIKTVANVGPNVVSMINDGYDTAKAGLCAVGGVVSKVREGLSYTGIETPELPTNDVDTAVLGSTFGLTYLATSFMASVAAPIVRLAVAPGVGALQSKMATQGIALGLAALHTAAPGQVGTIASSVTSLPGKIAQSAAETVTDLPSYVKTTATGTAAVILSYLGSVVAAARYRAFK
jgi:hypothetical protein